MQHGWVDEIGRINGNLYGYCICDSRTWAGYEHWIFLLTSPVTYLYPRYPAGSCKEIVPQCVKVLQRLWCAGNWIPAKEMGVADLFCCCGTRGYQNADTYLQPLNLFPPRSAASLEEILEKSSKAREHCWEDLGSLEPLVLKHAINPALSGGPKWPALRQSFRLIRRANGNVMLVSDGLSDPFDDVTLGKMTSQFISMSNNAERERAI